VKQSTFVWGQQLSNIPVGLDGRTFARNRGTSQLHHAFAIALKQTIAMDTDAAKTHIADGLHSLREDGAGLWFLPRVEEVPLHAMTAARFARHRAGSIPFIIRGGASHWPAAKSFASSAELTKLMGADATVTVDVTPDGLGDAVLAVPCQNTSEYKPLFVKPHERKMPFAELVGCIETQAALPRTNAKVRSDIGLPESMAACECSGTGKSDLQDALAGVDMPGGKVQDDKGIAAAGGGSGSASERADSAAPVDLEASYGPKWWALKRPEDGSPLFKVYYSR